MTAGARKPLAGEYADPQPASVGVAGDDPGEHISADFEANDEGWWVPKCACGWNYGGVVPSAEDACDALMDHVLSSVLAAARVVVSADRTEED